MKKRKWDYCDIIIVTGDAYVDHPSFGAAIISRVLESKGFRVGIISQPDWQKPDDFMKLGKPLLAFLVTAGNMDSMVNHYTAAKKVRKIDAYSPGGNRGYRPDRASIVYTSKIRQVYKGIPVILGGIEASLRRLGHYDYWSGKVRRSILLDSKADMVIYGMAEKTVCRIAENLKQGKSVAELTGIPGIVYKRKSNSVKDESLIHLPAFEEIKSSKTKFAAGFCIQYENTDSISASPLAENYGDWEVIQNPPVSPMTTDEMDWVYGLPFERNYHPVYESMGGVPALSEVRFSLTSSRGCFGGCNYCSLTFHQGRVIQARSHKSLIKEAEILIKDNDFKGYIHDVGGPTANFRKPSCKKQLKYGVCKNKQCLFPEPCSSLEIDHKDYISVLRKLRSLSGIKKVFIRSGIRYDYLLADRDQTFLKELCKYHVSGQLKVAPEHVSKDVLNIMGRQDISGFIEFSKRFNKINREIGKKQYLIPYLISGHPGSTLKHAIELAEFLRDNRFIPDQVQDFYPTPGTLSTCIYYTGIHPVTGEPVYAAVKPHEKAMQRALIHYKRPENRKIVYEALIKAGRKDLIGFSSKCLIPPVHVKSI